MIERKVLAVCLAHVNLEYPEPSVFEIANCVSHGKNDIEVCVSAIFRGKIHSTSDKMMFVEEAESFLTMMEGKTDAQLKKIWPDRSRLLEQCVSNINID